jgi:protein-S-isoprenylcysteine O-methyltransferase Ste14
MVSTVIGGFVDGYGASIAAFAVFGLLHSVGAREPFKNALARWTSPFFVERFWRLVYCALSFWALYYGVAKLHWARNPDFDVWLFSYPGWLWQIIIVLHLGSIALLYAAFVQSDYLEFLGLRQAYRGMLILLRKPAATPDLALFGTHRLEDNGVYGWVRHPMLLAGLLFLLTSGPSLNNIVYTAMYTGYMLIGGYYEERRMLKVFGDDYRSYQERVGAYIPRIRRRHQT